MMFLVWTWLWRYSAVVLMMCKKAVILICIFALRQTTIMRTKQFLVALEQKIGEQKIDVVMAVDSTRAIEQQALKNGIWLC